MLDSLATLLVGLHGIGAALGAGGATFAEIFYTKAIADGRIDAREQEYFSTTYWALRWGMVTVLVSGIVLIVVQYFLPGSPQSVLYAPLWMQNTLALVITITAWLMSVQNLPWWLGSSVIFSGWWMMYVLDAWHAVSISYLNLLSTYVFWIFIAAAAWGYARMLAHQHYVNRRQEYSS